MQPEGIALEKDFNGVFESEIVNINYSIGKLEVSLKSRNSTAVVEFRNVYGFRVLAREDMAEFWPEFSSSKGWIFKITAGGWKDLESTREDFQSATYTGLTEYLLTGSEDCLSVIGFSDPSVEYKKA